MEPEPPAKDSLLPAMDNGIVTPHAASCSEEAVEEAQRRMGERIVEALGGGWVLPVGQVGQVGQV